MPHHFRGLLGSIAVVLMATLAIVFRSAPEATRSAETAHSAVVSSTLRLSIVDAATGKPTPARFSVRVNGKPFYPSKLNSHGLRFVSIHEAKKQTYVVTYSRGTGIVEIALPANANTVEVSAAKGFEFLPESQTLKVNGDVSAKIALRRWSNQPQQGWLAADEHVHYDRLDRKGDRDWLTMLAGDGLHSAHFMILKGGKVPGLWAQQFAYGKAGEAFDGQRLIRSGEEYRDSAQGHINLLGLSKIIQPISTGGLGKPPVLVNYPPLLDVFQQTRKLGGLGGVAHGGSLGRHPTAIVDTTQGAVDFFEIGNAHLYAIDLWYRLMNCGFPLPAAAGTDLPNFPFRDAWQPFLGSMRMYVKTDGKRDFNSWKRAVIAGKTFVTSGPMLSLTINGVEPGGILRLPAGGGELSIDAELSSPIGLQKFEIVRMGKTIPGVVKKGKSGRVQRWRIRQRLTIRRSCWIAARGEGLPIKAMVASVRGKESWMKTDAIAHTGAIRVIVGKQPIRSDSDVAILTKTLRTQLEYYRTKGRYVQAQHRLRVVDLFEKAIALLESRKEQQGKQ